MLSDLVDLGGSWWMVDISCLTDNIPSGNFLHSYGIDGPFSANCDLPSYKTVIFQSANSTS